MDILPSWPVFVAFALAVTVLAITPGPDMTLFLSKTLAHGRKAGITTMLGATAGLVFHTMFAAFGLTALLAASATGFMVLKVVGAIYLLWLAFSALRYGSAFQVDRRQRGEESLQKLFFTGVGINLLNPKIILFFVTFLPQFVSPDDPNALGKLVFFGLVFVTWSIPICSGLIFAADQVSDLMRRSPKISRIIDWLFASVFAGFATVILFERGRG